MKKSRIYAPALLAAFGLVLVSCQGEQGSFRGKRAGSDGWAAVDFEAALSQTDDQSLSLADNDEVAKPVVAFKISAACDDVEAMDVDAAPFDLPVGAKNCVAKLKSITIGDKNYVEPAAGAGYKKYAVGEVGKFVNDKDAKDILYVRVVKQLPSPLLKDSVVQYDYSNIMSFDTIDGTREGIDNTFASGGDNAPQIKVIAAKLLDNLGLHISLSCLKDPGFVTPTDNLKIDQVTCASEAVKPMKLAVLEKTTDKAPTSAELQAAIRDKGKDFGTISPNLSPDKKLLKFVAPVKDSPFYMIVISNDKSYSYGYVRMKAGALAADNVCPPQGDQANFIHASTSTVTGIGRWKDTSNCRVWVRPSIEKVKFQDRFAICRKPSRDKEDEVGVRMLPYGSDMKAAYDRKIKDLAFGAAPKLGEENLTFWMAGGRVFKMATGELVSLTKAEQETQTHSILCFIKPKQ